MATISPVAGVCRALAAWCLVLSAVAGHARSAGSEYELKAVFLFHFAQFVEWPPSAFDDASAPLCIGVLGTDPFGDVLDATVRGEKVNGRNIVVRRYRRAEEIDACHILFVSRLEGERLREALETLAGRSILTVSDVENFEYEGGIVRFVTQNNRIRLRINLDAAKAARLTISSKLLRAADVISPGKK